MRHFAPLIPRMLFGLAMAIIAVVILLPGRPGPHAADASDEEAAGAASRGVWTPTPFPQRGDDAWPFDETTADAVAEPADEGAATGATTDDQPEKASPQYDGFQIDTAVPVDHSGDALGGDGFALLGGGGVPASLLELGW